MANQAFALSDRELEQAAGGRYVGPTFVYVIQEGGTLPLLAQPFGPTRRLLGELNSLTDPGRFRPGVRLLIPQR